ASDTGGGTFDVALKNCVVAWNSSDYEGGGTAFGSLDNCTLTGNSSATTGGGTWLGTLNNCIVYYNTASNSPNCAGSLLHYSCTTPPLTNGIGNFDAPPLFVDSAAGNFRPQSSSPCINAGNNAYVDLSDDLDGNPRIAGGTVDVGAYEFQSPSSRLSYAWA